MKRRNFLAGLSALLAASCAREERRAARYEPKECPFCTTQKGSCTYCGGTGKCSFCGGSGKRTTVVPDLPGEQAKPISYQEECTYCHGSGSCRYCGGTKKCWACDGDGTVENWDFQEKHQRKLAGS